MVIVHPENPVQGISREKDSDLYLGRLRDLGNGEQGPLPASVYEQPSTSALRERFFHWLNGMPIRNVNAYWARLRYSGEVLPPLALPNSQAVVEAVKRDRKGIGYVHSSEVDDSVKIVLRLKEPLNMPPSVPR